MKRLLFNFLFLFLLILFGGPTVAAQGQLDRISIAERSDGRGMVIRNHLSVIPDSFQVARPVPNRIQFVIYQEGLEFDGMQKPDPYPGIERIDYYAGAGFFGYEITMSEEMIYRSDAYPDVNGSDLLLSLEQSTIETIVSDGFSVLTLFNEETLLEDVSDDKVEPTDPESDMDEDPISDADEEETVFPVSDHRERVTVKIGLKGGYSSANIYGVGYGRTPRTGLTMATTVVIDLPAELPYKIGAGIETGVYYMQKGFNEPIVSKISAKLVEIDYIELPVLIKLNYDRTQRFSPHLIFGPYAGFMIAAERVLENDERRDMDDEIRSVDFGGMIGIGVDIALGEVLFDLQLRHAIGFNTLFDELELDDNEKLQTFSIVAGIRF